MYGIFARRKISLTNMINTYQMQLDIIMDKKQKLLNFSANIADGKITAEELASDPTNYNNYAAFLYGYDQFLNTSSSEGGAADVTAAIGDFATNQSTDEQYLYSIANTLNTSVSQEYANACSKKIDAMENQLELQQKKIETKIAALEKQLEAVEEAEQKDELPSWQQPSSADGTGTAEKQGER